MTTKVASLTAIGSIMLLALGVSADAQQAPMSFFVTSVGLGKGGDLGGLQGADRHCQSLAQAVGAGGKTWHAYLSTQGSGGVNAKDRIGSGPWFNAKGVRIASSVADLHGDNNKINKETALDEKGTVVPGRIDSSRSSVPPSGSGTGTISRALKPSARAAVARSCERLAYRSISSRVMS